MTKNIKLILIPIFLFFLSACSNDDDGGIPNTSEELVAINIEYFQNNTLQSTEKLNFYDNRLIYIQYSDGSYDDIYYTGNLVSRILEFDINNQWEWTTEYKYDSSERLIDKKVVPGTNNPINTIRHKEIFYNGNTINSTLTWSDDGGVMKNIISLNSEGLIMENQFLESSEQTSYFEYNNRDLMKSIYKSATGEIWNEITYSYRDETPSEAYFYNSYLYGKHWNDNLYLQEQFTPSYTELSKIGGHYIKGYQRNNLLEDYTDDASYDYVFDSDGRIKTQTEYIVRSTGLNFKRVYNFEYR